MRPLKGHEEALLQWALKQFLRWERDGKKDFPEEQGYYDPHHYFLARVGGQKDVFRFSFSDPSWSGEFKLWPDGAIVLRSDAYAA